MSQKVNEVDGNGDSGAVEKFVSWRLCGYLNEVPWPLEEFRDSGEESCGAGIDDRPECDRYYRRNRVANGE
jgi:hypothetical protein